MEYQQKKYQRIDDEMLSFLRDLQPYVNYSNPLPFKVIRSLMTQFIRSNWWICIIFYVYFTKINTIWSYLAKSKKERFF